MTREEREEAIKVLENERACVLNDTCQRAECADCAFVMETKSVISALDLALAALRDPTREMVERMRGEWKTVPRIGVYDMTCSKCGYAPGIRFFSSDFCPNCGAPMTAEAVEMVMERMETLYGNR